MEVDDLTLQLRRAYRLVHGYQRAIFDLAREIGARLGLEFYCWEPVFNDAPGRFRTDISRKWAWDFLPAYSIYFAFTSPGPIKKGSYMLVLWAEADTGFSKLCEETSRGEPDFTKLDAPENCATTFRFWHSVIDDSPKRLDSQTFWNTLWHEEWPETDVFAMKVQGTSMKGGMKVYPLSALSNGEELNHRLEELKKELRPSQ